MNLRARQSQSFGVEDCLSNVGQLATDYDKFGARNDAFELRNEDAVYSSEVQDANIPVSGVFLHCFCDVVPRNIAQHLRWVCMHTHSPAPQHDLVTTQSCALSDSAHKIAKKIIRHSFGQYTPQLFHIGTFVPPHGTWRKPYIGCAA